MSSSHRLFLIDGHALAYRTYFALTRGGDSSRWETKSGEPTAGTYGFVSVLLRLLEQESPEYLAVSFDTGRTFRDDIFPDYKGTRQKMPEDLRPQIKRIREIVSTFGIPLLEAEGYEADDVLGTVARQAAAQGIKVTILTGDRDLLQLADANISIRLAGQKLSEAVDYGPDKVEKRYGIKPRQIVDYKALVGDASDNIPGVRGIGEKTATSLLQQYDDLDTIYANLDQIPTRFRNKLIAGRAEAYLSRDLAAIVTDVPLSFDLEECRARGYSRDKIAELFRALEFHALLKRLSITDEKAPGRQLNLFVSQSKPEPIDAKKAAIINTPEALHKLTRRLQAADKIAFDVETTSTHAMRADLVGISLAISPDEGFYIPVGHLAEIAGSPQLPLDLVLEALRLPLTDLDKPKIGHNLKYDFIVLARYGLAVAPLSFDTMIAEWLCDPASRSLSLKKLAWVRLGIEMTQIEELIGHGRNQRSMAEVPISEVAPYAAADAQVCLRLMPVLQSELEAKEQWGLFNTIEMPLVPILADMERAGVGIDVPFLRSFSESLARKLSEIEDQVFDLVGHPFNLNSTQQLSRVLFEELKLSPPSRAKKTASGHYSTAAIVLEELRTAHPVVEFVLKQREIAKIKSTYADALPDEVNSETGRIHTSFNQAGSVTGRLASSDPNLQNIPIRTELGREIRRAFISGPGMSLLAVDYSQVELRIVAHMADDKAMIQTFLDGQDIHTTTAAAIFGVEHDQVTPAMRRRAKAVNFGLIYGMSSFGLSRSTDLTLAEAENFVKTYFERFPGVQRYLDQARRSAAAKGYVETLLGRRRYFPQLKSDATAISEAARSRAQREAVNAPIQGTAADIIKIAMLRLPHVLRAAGLTARMLLQVHDELILECTVDELKETASLVKKIMQNAFDLRVPLKTDAKAGPNWAELNSLH